MHSKSWKITKMLLVVLVLLTVNIGCAPVQGEDNMTHVEWSTFYMSRNHQFRTMCYRFEVNYDPFKEGQGTFSCFFVDKKGGNCLLSSAEVTSEDLQSWMLLSKSCRLRSRNKSRSRRICCLRTMRQRRSFILLLATIKIRTDVR